VLLLRWNVVIQSATGEAIIEATLIEIAFALVRLDRDLTFVILVASVLLSIICSLLFGAGCPLLIGVSLTNYFNYSALVQASLFKLPHILGHLGRTRPLPPILSRRCRPRFGSLFLFS